MNDVERDFLKQISENMDITDIIDVLGITEETLVERFADEILESNKYYEFRDFLGIDKETSEEDEEV